MNTLKDFIIYIFENYPNPSELSKARLVKILYLADWKAALDYGHQLTGIDWFFNHYGPYVEEVMDLVKTDSNNFRVEIRPGSYGGYREAIYLLPNHDSPVLNGLNKEVLNFVIKLSYPLHWDKFIELVYSTYPIQKSVKYSYLDLVSMADAYRKSGFYRQVVTN